jgi:hypothetical protein
MSRWESSILFVVHKVVHRVVIFGGPGPRVKWEFLVVLLATTSACTVLMYIVAIFLP